MRQRPLHRARAATELLLRFLLAVVTSGLQTVGVILRNLRGRPVPSALMRVPLPPVSANGAALLGCLITLTPGSTTLDIDLERGELLLHVLDARDPQAVVEGIRHSFEPCVVALFGTHPSTGAS